VGSFFANHVCSIYTHLGLKLGVSERNLTWAKLHFMDLVPGSFLLYFIFYLFDGAVISSDYIASNGLIMNEYRIGKDVK